MNTLIIVFLVLVGVVLMLVEFFLIPGFGLAGLCSIACMAAAVAWAYMQEGLLAGYITLFVALLLLGISLYYFLRGKALEKMSLKTDIPDKVDLMKNVEINVGDVVKTTSRLAPMGKVMVGTTEFEAKSTDFIEENTDVRVVKIEGNILVVIPV